MKSDTEFFQYAMRGDESAVALVRDITTVASVWDDMVDRDKPVDNDRINAAFWAAMVSIPSNVFYRKNFDALQPLIQSAIVGWWLSDGMKFVAGTSREIAHVIRYGGAEVFVMMAGIVGGKEWAVEVGPEIWTRTMRDTFAAFNAENGGK